MTLPKGFLNVETQLVSHKYQLGSVLIIFSDAYLAKNNINLKIVEGNFQISCFKQSLVYNLNGHMFQFDGNTMTMEEQLLNNGSKAFLVDLKKVFNNVDASGDEYQPITTGLSVNGVSLDSGYATITNEIQGQVACGQDQSIVSAKAAKVDAFGAIPQTFYKYINGQDYNPKGLLSCNNCCGTKYNDFGGGCPIILDNSKNINNNMNICYKLTTNTDVSFTIIPNDTCNGNCIGLMDNPPKPYNRCVTGESPSCMNVIPRETAWQTQNLPQNRCPPIIFCAKNKEMNFNEIQESLKTYFTNNLQIQTPVNAINIPPYAPVPKTTYTPKIEIGQCDWCSGKNMHFDVQFSPHGSVQFDDILKTGQVVKYQLIKCPKSYLPLSPGSPIGPCGYKKCSTDSRGGWDGAHTNCYVQNGGCGTGTCYVLEKSNPKHTCCI